MSDKWLQLVADAVKIESSHITQFSPKGFCEAMPSSRWWSVKLGELHLCHDGEWIYSDHRDQPEPERLQWRLRFAFKTASEALAAARAALAPVEPACAEIVEKYYIKETG